MRSRTRRTTTSQASGPSLPTDTTPTRRARARAPAVDRGEGEGIDRNASQPLVPSLPTGTAPTGDEDEDDEEDDEDEDDEDGDDGDGDGTPATKANLGVNNPDLPQKKLSTAADVHYFYETRGDIKVCVVCSKIVPEPKCNYIYSTGTSTTSLRPHLEAKHEELYMSLAKERGWTIQLPKYLARSLASAQTNTSQGERPDRFNEIEFHNRLVRFIIANDLSLNLIESSEFRQLLLFLRSTLSEKMIPHRTKVRQLVINMWREFFQVLRGELAAAMGCISFTIDSWSDQNRRPYLAMTAHWVERHPSTSALRLRTALVAFHRLRSKHDGNSLADVVFHLLDRAGITAKIGHFTSDNASNNRTMMTALQKKLASRDISFDAVDQHVMCFGHIINLGSGRVIDHVQPKRKRKNNDEGDNSSADDDDDIAPPSDPIAHARSVVKTIRASGKRRDEFEGVVKNGNDKGWFMHGKKVIKLDNLQLLRDVRTRWDSVYLMLKRLRTMRPAVDYFLALPNNKDLARYKISPDLWEIMEDVEAVLTVPHKVQDVMSGERSPILSSVIPTFESFMTTWENLSKRHPKLTPIIEPGLTLAYKYYNRMDDTKAYIISMFLNPAIRMSWIKKHWEQEYIDMAEKSIRRTIQEYRKKNATGEDKEQPVQAHTQIKPSYLGLSAKYSSLEDMEIGDSQADENTQTVEQEYQAYVTGGLSSTTVDILKFWEVNSATHPTLFAMAMDYLPVQASAVPCERVFSSSAETDTKRRNRINPLLMEAIQMLKMNLRTERLSFTSGWITVESQMVEDIMDKDHLHDLLRGDANDSFDTIMELITKEESDESNED